jgi:hypothetical protein
VLARPTGNTVEQDGSRNSWSFAELRPSPLCVDPTSLRAKWASSDSMAPHGSSDGRRSLPFFGSSHRFIFSFRQRNQCKRERRDRILAQVTCFNEVPYPPALRFTISWRTGGLSAPPGSRRLSAGVWGGFCCVRMHQPAPWVPATVRQGLGGLCCVRMIRMYIHVPTAANAVSLWRLGKRILLLVGRLLPSGDQSNRRRSMVHTSCAHRAAPLDSR